MGAGGLPEVLLNGQRMQIDLRTARHGPRCASPAAKFETHLKSEAVRHAPISPVRAEHASPLIGGDANPDDRRRRPFCRPDRGTCPLLPRTTTGAEPVHPDRDEVAKTRTHRQVLARHHPPCGRMS